MGIDTKRCQRCHKVLRADAHSCSRCGYVFSPVAPVKRNGSTTNGSRRTVTLTMPSNPPASPHRAGHYSGLHPEDQPFQSTFMPVQRAPAITRSLVDQEAGVIVAPAPPPRAPDTEGLPDRRVAVPAPLPLPLPQRSVGSSTEATQRQFVSPLVLPDPETNQRFTGPVPALAPLPREQQRRSRVVPVLLFASCLLFLLATSALAFLLLDRRPAAPTPHASATVTPGPRAASAHGSKSTPVLKVTATAVPSVAKLSARPASLSFNGTANQNPSSQPLTLQNSGGQPLDWEVAAGTTSGGNWLSASPAQGPLNANSQATISVSANSTGLSVGSYQGNLFISYAGGTYPVKVTLTVSVTPLPAMGVTTSALSFNTIQGTDPAPQSFTISNTGKAPLHWAATEDRNGAAFAPVSPKQGTVAPGKTATITVTPTVAGATAGVINALITIADTDKGTPVPSQQVNVAITILNQAVINVSTAHMTCTVTNPTQLLLITNTGSAPLDWTLVQPSQPLPSWLSLDVTGGTLSPAESKFVNVTCDSTGLSAGSYKTTLVVSDTDAGTPVVPQDVQVTLAVS